MRTRIPLSAFFLFILLVPWLLNEATRPGTTQLDLMEAGTGRPIFSAILHHGEQVELTWKNSLFGLQVTEVFQAQNGILVLNQITFADPRDKAPPVVSPSDVDDLYHTGGAFSVKGIAKPFMQVVYRVGEIGNPKMRIGDRVVAFKEKVGFGGGVILSATKTGFLETVPESLLAL